MTRERDDTPMTTPYADGWITHDGGPRPVDPETWVQIREGEWEPQSVRHADDYAWGTVTAYRVFTPAHTTPGPSPFVRETAARIMAVEVAKDDYEDAIAARRAVRAALALEAALKGVK